MRFTDVLGRSERSALSQMEAAELLGIGERTFRRWRDRHRDVGLEGLDDRRLAPSVRRAPVAEIERMLGLYRDLYRGFTVKHFHEQLGKRHNYTRATRSPRFTELKPRSIAPRQTSGFWP